MSRSPLPFLTACCAMLLVGSAELACADEGLFLSWNECPLGATHASNVNFTCGTDTGNERLFLAFRPGATIDSVLGIEAVVDIQVAAPDLPCWWKMSPSAAPPEQRAGSLTASQDYTSFPACVDPWMVPSGPAIVQAFEEGQPGGIPSHARIKVVAGTLSTQPAVTVTAGTPGPMYNAVQVLLDHRFSTIIWQCSGCQTQACLVLESIWLRRVPGAADILITTPGAGDANWVAWRGADITSCVALPARRTTWGQLKSLYR